jgi:hypothetical protein
VSDGSTVDGPFTGSSATSNALVTLSTTLGSLAGTDASPSYAGFLVLAGANGHSSFFLRPTAAGTATVTAEEVSGASFGTMTRTYTLLQVRRFDFNGPSSATAAGFYDVRGGDLYTASRGYGRLCENRHPVKRPSSTACSRTYSWTRVSNQTAGTRRGGLPLRRRSPAAPRRWVRPLAAPPRRRTPPTVEPEAATAADVRTLSLAPHAFATRVRGLFFVPLMRDLRLAGVVAQAQLPGSAMIPALQGVRTLLALKRTGTERKSHIMDLVDD